MVQISLQNSCGKVVFLGGFYGNPPPSTHTHTLGTNGSESSLVTKMLIPGSVYNKPFQIDSLQ